MGRSLLRREQGSQRASDLASLFVVAVGAGAGPCLSCMTTWPVSQPGPTAGGAPLGTPGWPCSRTGECRVNPVGRAGGQQGQTSWHCEVSGQRQSLSGWWATCGRHSATRPRGQQGADLRWRTGPVSSTVALCSREGKGRGTDAAAASCRCMIACLQPASPGCVARHCMQHRATSNEASTPFSPSRADAVVEYLHILPFPLFSRRKTPKKGRRGNSCQ
jgi:hypothetical protein